MINKNIMIKEFEQKIRKEYSIIQEDSDVRALDAIQRIIEHSKETRRHTKEILEEIARLIFSMFKFKEVIIGLKDQKDELFKHEIFLGYSPQVEKILREATYEANYFLGNEKHKGIPFSKFTKYRMIEHQLPEEWHNAYEKASESMQSLRNPRTSLEDMHEGDEIYVLMYGLNSSLMGWIDLGLTIDKKLPSSKSLKYIELIASIAASIVNERELLQN